MGPGYKQRSAGGCSYQGLTVNIQGNCPPIVIKCWQLEIGHGGDVYATKIFKGYRSGLPFWTRLLQELVCQYATDYETRAS